MKNWIWDRVRGRRGGERQIWIDGERKGEKKRMREKGVKVEWYIEKHEDRYRRERERDR